MPWYSISIGGPIISFQDSDDSNILSKHQWRNFLVRNYCQCCPFLSYLLHFPLLLQVIYSLCLFLFFTLFSSFLLFCFLYLLLINCFAICLVHYFWTFLLISLPSSTFLCFFKNLLYHSFLISSSYIFISASLFFEIYQACFIILISHQCNSDFCISNMMRIIDSTLFL